MQLKSAISGALKRCAVNLGDQFGLSLYRDGSVAPVVQRSLVAPSAGDDDAAHRDARPEVVGMGDCGLGGADEADDRGGVGSAGADAVSASGAGVGADAGR
jgi:hypothetical protein